MKKQLVKLFVMVAGVAVLLTGCGKSGVSMNEIARQGIPEEYRQISGEDALAIALEATDTTFEEAVAVNIEPKIEYEISFMINNTVYEYDISNEGDITSMYSTRGEGLQALYDQIVAQNEQTK